MFNVIELANEFRTSGAINRQATYEFCVEKLKQAGFSEPSKEQATSLWGRLTVELCVQDGIDRNEAIKAVRAESGYYESEIQDGDGTLENQPIECIGLDYFEDGASFEDLYGRGEPMTNDPGGIRVVYAWAPGTGLFHWMKKHNVPNAKIPCDGGAIIAARTLDHEELHEAVEEIRVRGEAHWVVGIDVDEVDQFVVYRSGLTPEQREMANKNLIYALEVLNIGEELHGELSAAIPDL